MSTIEIPNPNYVMLYIHEKSVWVQARDYQVMTFNDFQQNVYMRQKYISDPNVKGLAKKVPDIVDRRNCDLFGSDDIKIDDITNFESPDRIGFEFIRDNDYVYLINNKREYNMITNNYNTFTAYNNHIANIDLFDSKSVLGIDLARELRYPIKFTGSNWFEKTFGFNESLWAEHGTIWFNHMSKSKSSSKNIIPNVIYKPTSFSRLTPEILKQRSIIEFVCEHGQKNYTRSFFTGAFGTPTLAELREFVIEQKYSSDYESTLSNVIINDVFNTHSNPLYKGALFQVASQFNCLEFPSANVVPENGITNYVNDRTQGPACAVPTGAATFYRNYLVHVKDGIVHEDGETFGQSTDNQINCLIDVMTQIEKITDEKIVTVKNGYTFSSEEKLEKLNRILSSMTPADISCLMDNLRIGTQFNISVTLGKDRNPLPPNQLQIVSQAFCSAISIAYDKCSTKSWEPFARAVLDASYEATFLAAIVNKNNGGSNKVVLTLVGGGVFGNSYEWIAESIYKAYFKTRAHGLDVEIAHRDINNQQNFMVCFNKIISCY